MSTYLPGFLRPEGEGALRLHSLGRPGGHLWPHVDSASLLSSDFIDFLYKPRNTSLFSSLLYFLIYNILSLSLSKSFSSLTLFLLWVPLDPAGAGPQHLGMPVIRQFEQHSSVQNPENKSC